MSQKKYRPIYFYQDYLKGVHPSETALRILDEEITLDQSLGLKIFLDRYSKKGKREDATVGDLIVVLVKDGKWPKKQLGVIVEDHGDEVTTKLLTGDDEFEAGSLFRNNKKHNSLPLESVLDTCWRVAKAAASVEKPEDRRYWERKFYENLSEFKIVPGGRIMTGAISPEDYNSDEDGELTLFNCFVIPSPHDSRGGIMTTLHQMTEIMSRGGGVGINLSTLRPKRAYVKGVRGESSGAVSWGGLFSYTTGLIEQGGSRRGALMLMMNDFHPDCISFIESKQKSGMIENANISIIISNDFMKAVKNDEDWTFKFPITSHPAYDREWDGDLQKWIDKGYPVEEYQTMKAKEIWNKIIQSAWKSAEPGVVFGEYYNQMSNSWYFNPIIATNPCGEQGLPAWGVCTLSHLNLSKFKNENPQNEEDFIKWEELKETIHVHQRFLDNIVDLTPYHFKENEDNQKKERRIGAGTLGLAELFIKLNIRYGSHDSIELIDELYRFITVETYLASSNTAAEKGSFLAYDEEKFPQSGFMKFLAENAPEVIQSIKKKGIRNVTLITQAPTGTTGSMVGTSTGIEPFFAFKYFRQSRLGFDEIFVPIAQEWLDNNPGKDLPNHFVDANSLSPYEHIAVQAAIQKWTDSSISKTANVPSEFTVDQVNELYVKAFELGCKGVTIYRDGSRDEQVLHLVKEEVSIEDKPHANEQAYGFSVGDKCANCREGVIIKRDGCTECSNGCGYVGACDMK